MASGGSRLRVVVTCLVAIAAIAAPAAFSARASMQSSLSALDAGVLQQLNAVRVDHGLAALRSNSRLAAAADAHSREMADDGYFDHSSFDGTSFSTRIAKWYPMAGFRSWTVGENLLWSSPGVDPAGAVAMWMHSPAHRANILNAGWREIGVGAVRSPSARGYFGGRQVTIITTDFGVRR